MKKKTKVCNRCKVRKSLKNFTKESRQRLSGEYTWYHPWCFKCRNIVKANWKVFGLLRGRKENGEKELRPIAQTREHAATSSKKESNIKLSNKSKSTSNMSSNTKQSVRSVSSNKTKRYKDTNRPLNKRSGGVHRRGETIITTLKKLKDVKNV